MLIPFPPGGGADISGRIIGRVLTERLGVQFVIDNRPGASTMIATDLAAKAPTDGYTLLMSTGTHTINPSIFVKRPFDEIRDFTPIVLVSNAPNMIAVNINAPAKNLTDFVAHAKANPGQGQLGHRRARHPSAHGDGAFQRARGYPPDARAVQGRRARRSTRRSAARS